MLCVDLTEPGTIITGNRIKTTAPVDAMEPMKAVADGPSDVPADDNPTTPGSATHRR